MLKLLKEILRTGNATVQYPFAPYEASKDFRGKPEHDAEKCIACAACTIACPPNAIHMDTDLDAGTRTWSIDYGRCIFCGRCEESCPTGAIALTPEFELAVMNKEDLTVKAVFQLDHCRSCGKPFAPSRRSNTSASFWPRPAPKPIAASARSRSFTPAPSASARTTLSK